MKKILKIAHLNFAKGFRGGERQTLTLIEELAKRGYSQWVYTRVDAPLAQRVSAIKGVHICEVSKPYILNVASLKEMDIVHAHETKAAQVAYFASLIFSTPYIITRRVDNAISKNILNTQMYTKAKQTVVLSHAIKEETLKVSKKINVKIIPSAYTDFKRLPLAVEKIKKRFENRFLIGNIGELDNGHKGQAYLLSAFLKLVKKYPDMHLIMIGKGKDLPVYQAQTEGCDAVTFEGFVDNVDDYIQALDLFVFPSLHEGLGSILFDVMRASVPIIATHVGGIPDIIEDGKTGCLVASHDEDALYKAIEKLYHDKKLRASLASCALSGIENFSPQAMATRYVQIYEEML